MSGKPDDSRIEVVTRHPDEEYFSTQIPVPGSGFPEEPDIALGPDGSLVVIWKESASEDDVESVIKLAKMPRGSVEFEEPETLSPAGVHFSPPKVGIRSDGEILAVWDRDITADESQICLASIPHADSGHQTQTFPKKADSEEFGRPCYPNVVVGGNDEVMVTWNTDQERHWVFREGSADTGEWSSPSCFLASNPYDTVLHPDGLAIVPTWEAVESDDEWGEDLGPAGEGEIWLKWMNASPDKPDREGSNWIIEGESVEGPKVSLGPDGTLALVFRHHYELRVGLWTPGEDWEDRPELLHLEPPDESPESSAQVLVGPDGEVTVIWIGKPGSGGIGVVSATRPAGSDDFETPGELRKVSEGKTLRDLGAASDDSGSIVACWLEAEWLGSQEEHQGGSDTVFAVVKPAGEADFSEPIQMGESSGEIRNLSMATGSDGTTAMAWATEKRG